MDPYEHSCGGGAQNTLAEAHQAQTQTLAPTPARLAPKRGPEEEDCVLIVRREHPHPEGSPAAEASHNNLARLSVQPQERG